MNKNKYLHSMIWIITYLATIIAMLDTKMMPFLRFFDESIIVLLAIGAFIKVVLKKYTLTKQDIILCALFILPIISGLVGSFVYKYQPLTAVIMDILRFIRLPLAYFGTKILFSGFNIRSNKQTIKKVLIIVITAIIAAYITHLTLYLLQINLGIVEMRYGIPLVGGFFNHNRFMVTALICSMLMFLSLSDKHTKQDYIIMGTISIIIFLTVRSTQMALILLMWAMWIASRDFKISIPTIIYVMGAIVCVAFFVQRLNGEVSVFLQHARGKLYYYSIQIAKDHFPFGAGFGTFGTDTSWYSYSVLYEKYGLADAHGFALTGTDNYISDTSWAPIIAQTGIVGSISSLAIIILYYLKTVIRIEALRSRQYVLRLMWLYVFITSITGAIVMGSETLICAFTFAIIEHTVAPPQSFC